MPVLDAADVAPQKPGALLDVALREFLFFTKFAESVADDHAGIIPLRGLEGKPQPPKTIDLSTLSHIYLRSRLIYHSPGHRRSHVWHRPQKEVFLCECAN